MLFTPHKHAARVQAHPHLLTTLHTTASSFLRFILAAHKTRWLPNRWCQRIYRALTGTWPRRILSRSHFDFVFIVVMNVVLASMARHSIGCRDSGSRQNVRDFKFSTGHHGSRNRPKTVHAFWQAQGGGTRHSRRERRGRRAPGNNAVDLSPGGATQLGPQKSLECHGMVLLVCS